MKVNTAEDGESWSICHKFLWFCTPSRNSPREFRDTGPVDIEITSVVRERTKGEVLFHTINHPAPTVMGHVAERTIEMLTAAVTKALSRASPGTARLHGSRAAH